MKYPTPDHHDPLHRPATEPGLWQTLSQNAATNVRQNFEHRTQIVTLESIYHECLTRSAPL